jgi:hypothetical protein
MEAYKLAHPVHFNKMYHAGKIGGRAKGFQILYNRILEDMKHRVESLTFDEELNQIAKKE